MKNDKIKILALFGKSGAGKDTIQKWLVRTQDMHGIIPCTTRPQRENEEDKIDYYFMSPEGFSIEYALGHFLEATEFNNWKYGTLISSLRKDKINVGVFNIQGIQQLLCDNRIKVCPVYIECQNKIRLLRCLNREKNVNCYEVCRRYLADEKDFKNVIFPYVTYDNSFDLGTFNILNLPEVKEFIEDINS